jgi:hypothetical protein
VPPPHQQAASSGVPQPPQQAAGNGDTITLQQQTPVHVKYGTTTLPAGLTLHVVSRDPKGITVEYNGELVVVPPQ